MNPVHPINQQYQNNPNQQFQIQLNQMSPQFQMGPQMNQQFQMHPQMNLPPGIPPPPPGIRKIDP